jgi:hypothetical protein
VRWSNSKVLKIQGIDLKTKSKVPSKNKERDITRIEGSFQNQEPDNTGWEVIKSYIQSEEWCKVGEEQWKNCRQFSKSGE